MINRVLIRIKVVQLLYSYLLNQSEFKIAEAPTDASKDNRYAYSLYLDLLLLVVELSGYDIRPGRVGMSHKITGSQSTLSGNKMVKALMTNDSMKGVMVRENNDAARFDSLLQPLLDKIMASSIYRSYVRQKDHNLKTDAEFWSVVIRTILAKDQALNEAARGNSDFTIVGYEKAFDMVERSLSGFAENRSQFIEARNALDKSFDQAYELYHRLLLLMVEITRQQDLRLDNAKHKFLPTPEDLNPSLRFVENRLVAKIAENPDMMEYLDENKLSWTDDYDVLIKHLLDKILESDIYDAYMSAPESNFADDCEFWRKVYKTIILPSDELAEALETKSVYWNDDLEIMGTFVIKTIKRFASAGENEKVSLLPKYKDEIDERFGPKLFVDAIENIDTYRSYIQRFTSETWEVERLAFMDIVILVVAISELLNFPEIPIPVTVNEYVEIANCYSTSKSGQFVNGMLSTLIKEFKAEGKLLK